VALEVHHVETAHGAKARQVETDDRGDVLRISAVCVEVIGSSVGGNAAVPVGSVDAKVVIAHDRSISQGSGWLRARRQNVVTRITGRVV